jgi:hypothetical protein
MSDLRDPWDDMSDFGEEDEDVEEEESSNRTFIIGAIILGAVFVIGICIVLVVIFSRNGLFGGGQQAEVSPNELTNQVNATYSAETQAAVFETQQAAAEEPIETEEPTEAPTELPTATSVPPTAVPTELAEVTAEIGGGTNTPESSIIEVTPLPVTPADFEESGGGQDTGVGGAGAEITPTGKGGPSVHETGGESLPQTGFMNNGGVSLAGIGLMAVVLVAVVFVARRIRLK